MWKGVQFQKEERFLKADRQFSKNKGRGVSNNLSCFLVEEGFIFLKAIVVHFVNVVANNKNCNDNTTMIVHMLELILGFCKVEISREHG